MDTWGFVIAGVSLLLYFLINPRKGIFLFTAGVGVGIVIGGVWAMVIINNIL